jgi:dTDP-4-dehydrorhamnose reductase
MVSVVRPSVIYSWSPEVSSDSSSGKPLNFAMWLLSQLRAGKEVEIVRDQIASPTLADDLALAIISIAKADVHGVFHAAGATPMSRYDFATALAGIFNLDVNLITPVSTSELKQLAKRPKDSSLLSDRLSDNVGHRMMSIEEALTVFRQQSS